MGDIEACDECKLKCSLIHANKTDPLPLVTTFIKIIFGRYDVSKYLCLPQKISKAIPVLVAGEKYILQDTNGQQWEVKLGTKDGLLAFREGWTKFYEDHGLRVGYVLTFHYLRSSYFVVEIFDTTGFEKLKFPVAAIRKKRKRSEIEGNCNKVGECPNLSDHSAKKQGAACQHVASANFDTEQIYMINRDNGCSYEEDRSLLLNLANSELKFSVDPNGGSDSRHRSSNTSAEFDVVAGILNENTVSANVMSEPPAEVISSTLSKNITSKRANLAEVDNYHHGEHPYVPPKENQGLLLNLLNSELQFRVYPDGGSGSRLHPSSTSAQSDAVARNLNEKTVSAKVVNEEPPAEVAAPTLFNNITSKRANMVEVDSDHHGDHPYIPTIENQIQVPSGCRIKSPITSSKRFIEEAAGLKKHSGYLNENTVSSKLVRREPPAEAAAPTLCNIITSYRANMAEVDKDHHGDYPYAPPIENQGPLLNLLNSKLQFRVYHDGGSGSRPYPSSTSAQSGAVVDKLNENTVSAKVVSTESPAGAVDNDHHGGHPYVPSTENQDQVPTECRIKSPTMSSKRIIEKAAGRKKHSEKLPKSSHRSAQTYDGVERYNEVRRVVKTKPVDLFNDDSLEAPVCSFTATVQSHEILELPESVKLWESVQKKVVNLQGPNEVVWPVLYYNELGIKALTSGWEHFYRSCRLRKGDRCAFILEDEAKTIFRVDVTPNSFNSM